MRQQRELGLLLMNLAELYQEPIHWDQFDLNEWLGRISVKMDQEDRLFLQPVMESLGIKW